MFIFHNKKRLGAAAFCGAFALTSGALLAADPVKIQAAEAFIDADPGQGSGSALVLTSLADESVIQIGVNSTLSKPTAPGTHVLSMRFQDDDGVWSDPVKIAFPIYQIPTAAPNQVAAMEGFIGYPPPSAGNGTGFSGVFDEAVEQNTGYVSILSLPQGSYPYGARVRDTAGEWSGVVTMAFDYIDSDGDGIPDAYEDAKGMDKNDPSDAYGDGDNDKFSNLDEWLFDTDPDKFFDKPTGDPGCSSGPDNVVLPNSFGPGKHLCIGTLSIGTSGATTIQDGAYLYLRAPAVDLKPQVRVEDGGRIRTRTSDLTTP
jgi:hypothetical protein